MARYKHEVAAINIRIPADKNRNYVALIEFIESLQRSVRVYGSSHLAISFYDPKENIGIISKFDEIESDGDWFDLETFDKARPNDLIAALAANTLRPNHHRFYFTLDEELHVIAVSTYGGSKPLSLNLIEKYFRAAFRWKDVVEKFGNVEADIVKDHAGVRKLLELPHIREISITIRPPNPDDVGPALAAIMEKRLHKQHASEYTEKWVAAPKASLDLDQETKALGEVAADNGEVTVKNVEDGLVVSYTTDDMPLKEQAKFKDPSELGMFRVLAIKILEKIAVAREAGKA
ncbi:DUF4747 family protein [Agrobacterium leguminum]|nr:DUF4747 family protein [Agrobacterium leguminum]MCZ7933592.1 DUF4747 family protein [Agrobacterium leguminum]